MLDSLADLVAEGGRIAMRHWRAGVAAAEGDGGARAQSAIRAERKPDGTPLTQADREVDAFLFEELSRAFPGARIVTEERIASQVPLGAQERFFLVDPVDGTKEFVEGRDEFTVNVALVEGGVAVAGAICAPAKGRLFAGAIGQGAFEAESEGKRSKRPLGCGGGDGAGEGGGGGGSGTGAGATRGKGDSPDSGDAGVFVDSEGGVSAETLAPEAEGGAEGGESAALALRGALSRSHPSPEERAFLEDNAAEAVVRAGSSLKFCLLAAGRADLYPRFGPTMEWDVAAGHALLSAAGGFVEDCEGRELRYGKPEWRNGPFVARRKGIRLARPQWKEG